MSGRRAALALLLAFSVSPLPACSPTSAPQPPDSAVAVGSSEPAEEPPPPLLDINDPAREPDVVFWPTQPEVLQKMLEVADVKSTDIVYDLGSGDGRIVIAAAKHRGARGYGFEIDAKLVEESRRTAKEQGVDHLVTFERKDIFTVDVTPATVVMLYILPGMMKRLIPQLRQLRPGTRIVSHNFPMPGIEPDETHNADLPGSAHTVMLWRAPLKPATRPAKPRLT
jgi:SAM-dependent methyltransferase